MTTGTDYSNCINEMIAEEKQIRQAMEEAMEISNLRKFFRKDPLDMFMQCDGDVCPINEFLSAAFPRASFAVEHTKVLVRSWPDARAKRMYVHLPTKVAALVMMVDNAPAEGYALSGYGMISGNTVLRIIDTVFGEEVNSAE